MGGDAFFGNDNVVIGNEIPLNGGVVLLTLCEVTGPEVMFTSGKATFTVCRDM